VLQNIEHDLGVVGGDGHWTVFETLQVTISLGDVAQIRRSVELDEIFSGHEFKALKFNKKIIIFFLPSLIFLILPAFRDPVGERSRS
jgi:hypothetical protein